MTEQQDYNLQRARWRRRNAERKAERQAAAHPCAAPVDGRRCKKWGKILIAEKWFCKDHVPAWSVHYSIVERIRGFKNRDILGGER